MDSQVIPPLGWPNGQGCQRFAVDKGFPGQEALAALLEHQEENCANLFRSVRLLLGRVVEVFYHLLKTGTEVFNAMRRFRQLGSYLKTLGFIKAAGIIFIHLNN